MPSPSATTELEELKIMLKEKIELGPVVRFEAADGNVIGHYEHIQGGRGVNGVLVEIAGGNDELAHDIAVHIAFARPQYLTRDDVPADVVEAERQTLETITRNEGKPEAALPKIVEGRVNGFFKDVCLLEQPYAKDDKLVDHAGPERRRPSSASPKSKSADSSQIVRWLRCALAARCREATRAHAALPANDLISNQQSWDSRARWAGR